ncbi:MAG TPA: chemotaxis protein CheB [Ancylobacter sp.]
MSDHTITILIVEDSPAAREFLYQLMAAQPDFEVVGLATDGAEGLALADETRPDVVLMDANMPVMNGFQATRQIMERCPTRIIIVTASFEPHDVRTSMHSLEAGALTIVEKPWGVGHPDHRRSVQRLVDTIRTMSEVEVVRRWPARHSRAVGTVLGCPEHPYKAVAIGASTGGPRVLAQILRDMPADLEAPIFIVQHISPGFLGGLVDWLNDESAPFIQIAASGMRPSGGNVYFAPDDAQLGFEASGELRLSNELHVTGFRPSISHMFTAAAGLWGESVIGVLLSGMGRDGADGFHALDTAGAATIVQDPASCAVGSMPVAAIAAAPASVVLPPERIGTEICRLMGREIRHAQA